MLLLGALARGRGWTVSAATLDHGVRGARGREDRLFVERTARSLGLPCDAERREPPAADEAALRRLRQGFLREVAAARGAAAVALGHTLDDQAETLLHRLGRGAGSGGLGAMRRLAPPWWRPLLAVRRALLLRLLGSLGLTPREDETNRSPAATRNRIRARLVPALQDAVGPGAPEALARAAGLLAEDEELLLARALEARGRVVTADCEDALECDLRALRELPPALSRRLLRELLRERLPEGRELTSAHIEAVESLTRNRGPGRRAHLPAGIVVARRGGRVIVTGAGPRRSRSSEDPDRRGPR
jgi:tRNA(Ile)-lysidine synthetase-like protein